MGNHDVYYSEQTETLQVCSILAMGRARILRAMGTVIRVAREAAELSQEQLAVRAGIERAYLSQIENGRRAAGVLVYYSLARATGLSFTEFARRFEQEL